MKFLIAIIAFFGFDDPAKLTRWMLKLALIALPFANVWLESKGMPKIPDSLVTEMVAGLVALIIAAEAKAGIVAHGEAKALHAQVVASAAAALPTAPAAQAALVADLPGAVVVPAPAGAVNPASAP